MQQCVERTAKMPGGSWGKFVAVLAGWSPLAQAPVFVSVRPFDVPEVAAFTALRSTHFIQPSAAHVWDRSVLDLPFDPHLPEESGLKIVRAQRAQRFSSWHEAGCVSASAAMRCTPW